VTSGASIEQHFPFHKRPFEKFAGKISQASKWPRAATGKACNALQKSGFRKI
jgi:hypothetical protein